MVTSTSPSSIASSTPVTVTTCGVLQLCSSKETTRGPTVASLSSVLLSAIETVSVGCVLSTTVNIAVSPVSVVSKPAVGVTVTLASSSSALVMLTFWVGSAANAGSALADGSIDTVNCTGPSMSGSSTPVTIT